MPRTNQAQKQTKSFLLNLDLELYDQVKELAAMDGRSVTDMIHALLGYAIGVLPTPRTEQMEILIKRWSQGGG